MNLETAPLTTVNAPQAKTSPFGSVVRTLTKLFIPEPSADQLVPFQRAMRFAFTPPAVVNSPPATKSPFGSIVRATSRMEITEPSADQRAQDQGASQLAVRPP